jgi:hypothetical protein
MAVGQIHEARAIGNSRIRDATYFELFLRLCIIQRIRSSHSEIYRFI